MKLNRKNLFALSLIFLSILILVIEFSYFLQGNTIKFFNFIMSSVLMISAALAFSYSARTGSFNLGGDGQIYWGAFISALLLQRSPFFSPLWFILVFLIAGLSNGIFNYVWAKLKLFLEIPDIISTYLFSMSLIILIDYLVAIPLRNPESYFLATKSILDQFHLFRLTPSRLNVSILFFGMLFIVTYFIFEKGRSSKMLKTISDKQSFAEYIGLPVNKLYTFGLTSSGIINGWIGFFIVTGYKYFCSQSMTAGLGWDAIAISLIAGFNTALTISAAVVFLFIKSGVSDLLMSSNLSLESSYILQGIILFFITAKFFSKKRGQND